MTFLKFLQLNGEPYVGGDLLDALDVAEMPEDIDPDNLFEVSKVFMRTNCGDPEKILRQLVTAFNWWIVMEIKKKAMALARCESANRVVFLEEKNLDEASKICWKTVNKGIDSLSSNVQDIEVSMNFISSIQPPVK